MHSTLKVFLKSAKEKRLPTVVCRPCPNRKEPSFFPLRPPLLEPLLLGKCKKEKPRLVNEKSVFFIPINNKLFQTQFQGKTSLLN